MTLGNAAAAPARPIDRVVVGIRVEPDPGEMASGMAPKRLCLIGASG
jgi:hypothetical protein